MAFLFKKRSNYKKAFVRLYHGYGHTHNLVLYGHAFKKRPFIASKYSNKILVNFFQVLRLFFVRPFPRVKLQLRWEDQLIQTESEDDGFFKFEWQAVKEVEAGWHIVVVELMDEQGKPAANGQGSIFIPHSTQYGFISDIDDTILISHSATIGKRLKELFTRNAQRRKTFPAVATHYNLLTTAHTSAEIPNPFFYVSSSEWNLYDYLGNFFSFNQLPKGAFLLNQLKRWFQLAKTGKTGHQGKLLRLVRILEAFPRQQFVLFGDNSQSDPSIYATLATKMKGRIFAVYIRNVRASREAATIDILKEINLAGVRTCLFKDSTKAIEHSREIGLIS